MYSRLPIWILFLALLGACEQSTGPKYDRKTSAATDKSFGDGTFGDKTDEKEPPATETPLSTTPKPPPAEIAYPSMHFRAPQGNVASYDDINQVAVHMNQTIDDKEIVSNITHFDTVGKHDLRSHVQKLVGNTTYTRAASSQLTNVPGDFMFFATRARSQNQTSQDDQTYTKPLPVAVIPKELAGYSEIANGKTLDYTAHVNTTQVVDGKSKPYSYTVEMFVKSVDHLVSGKPANVIVIELYARIRADQKGELYNTLLIPYKTRFYVDYVQQKLVQMYVEKNYHHSGLNALRKMTMPFFLCTYTIRGQSTSFNAHLCQ
jgi:hypothetical protein